MARLSRRNRSRNRISNIQNIAFQPADQITMGKPKAASSTYNASKYIKRDLMMSALATGVVVVVLIILYIFLH
jgi:hypothetical protein